MAATVVIGEGLSKVYRLGASVQGGRLTEALWSGLAAPLRRLRGAGEAGTRTIWALRDVAIEVQEGEKVGIIGRNGAGKSTLLKIVSRITEPTTGWVELEGRVGSLLEVGSGFHPDLTGRENIYLYGAILGLPRREVRRKFDEIVAFAEVEDFLDTPVKRYSSGMYMRLAFAVAAHLEPDILIVDEVLAVGDLAFQKKCLGKMEDVSSGGRTVLFVSHNMAAVSSLCDRAYLLDRGRIVRAGPASEVVADYAASIHQVEGIPLADREDREGDGAVRCTSIRFEDADRGSPITCSSRLKISLGYRSRAPIRFLRCVITLYNADWVGILRLDSDSVGGLPDLLPAEGEVTCVTEPIEVTPGRCHVSVGLYRAGSLADHVEQAGSFEVKPDDFYGTGRLPNRRVLVLRRHRWSPGGS